MVFLRTLYLKGKKERLQGFFPFPSPVMALYKEKYPGTYVALKKPHIKFLF